MNIGFYYSCYDEVEAVKYSISTIKKYYPFSPIYLASEKHDFNYLEDNYLESHVFDDTMSIRHKPGIGVLYKHPSYQKEIKKCIYAVLDRLTDFIDKNKTLDYIVMMDPDAILRGKLNISLDAKLLGSKVNKGFPEEYKNILKNVPGAIVIDEWGATPAIFEVKSFIKAYNNIKTNIKIFDQLCLSFYAMYAHDVLLPTIFALIGIPETFNPDIVECVRNPDWEKTDHVLVHQFKQYYPKNNWSVIRIANGI
jgi:hypothetical protein